MRVLILGGYGVFGARLARLLVRDGHAVTIAGRNLAAAQALAAKLGTTALRLDREGDLAALDGHDVVVDAAGPFHAYGANPYRLARAAIAAGIHYLDLSDNADFCAGISVLDPEARAAGVAAISGLSSVPALSSAAVRALTGSQAPNSIDCAILPGNRSPRGLSVIASILTQAGRTYQLWRGGKWTQVQGWSKPKSYRLPGGIVRQGWQIEVPDIRLFPQHFGAETVEFRAGLELSLFRYGLAAFARLRGAVPFPVTPWIARAVQAIATLLSPFGSGQGGMSVMVAVGGEHRFWRLLAEDGDGPYVPAVPVRALLRRGFLPAGAGPALEIATLEELEAAMADLAIRFDREVVPIEPIFPAVLGQAFATLPASVRATHLTPYVSRWQGLASVKRGSGLWARSLAALFGFPPEAESMAIEVVKTLTASGETWERKFGHQVFRSYLTATPLGMTERFGPFTFLLGLHVQDAALHFPVLSGKLGPIPLPRWMLPVSVAREYEAEQTFRFDVRLLAPVTGKLLVHYQGSLAPAVSQDCAPPSNPA